MDTWQNLVLGKDWLSRIDRLAERRFGTGGLAEEAATFVVERLSEKDWARCREYRGGASRATFLHTLVNNSLEEFARQRFGRVRPPEWLKREGPLWVELWRQLCMERQLTTSVVDRAACGGRDRALVEEIVRTIRARLPWCGHSRQEIPLSCFEDPDGDPLPVAGELACDDDAATASRAQQYETALMALGFLLAGPEPGESVTGMEARAASVATRYGEGLARFGVALELSDEERLCLRLVFQDGLKRNEVGRLLGLPAHQPGRILARVFDRIRTALAQADIDLEVLTDALTDRG